jgi:hypothetical protein
MIKSSIQVSNNVEQLILTIRSLNFGEIFSVNPDLEENVREMEVSANEKALIDTLHEHRKIDIITVHQGEPVYAEIDKVTNKFRCRQKIKLS